MARSAPRNGPGPAVRPSAPTAGFDWSQAVAGVMALHRQGDLDAAEPMYRQLLQALPDNPNLVHFYGVLLHQRGRVDEALAMARRSIVLDPSVASWHNNLGNMLLDRRQLAEAAQAYWRCLELDPGNAEVRSNLGCLLRLGGRLEESEAVLRDALERRPQAAEARSNLALTLAAQGRMDEAMDEAARALELRPDNPRSRRLLGLLYARRGRHDLAAKVFRDWLAHSPDDPQARHHLASVSGEDVPGRATDAYVVDLFDRFASSFDAKLAALDYRAPELCVAVLRQRVGEPDARLRVLDAGCGTGLCGPLLRPFARELVGVDLSGGMLERARTRAIYDRLEKGELGAWLAACSAPFDAVVCADTLCYFGALDVVFAAARAACAADGWLVFTVEALDESSAAGWQLLPHGRYAHQRDAVEHWLRAAGWRSIESQPVVLRQEAGRPVDGWLVSAQAAGREGQAGACVR